MTFNVRRRDRKKVLRATDILLAGIIVLASIVLATAQLRPGQAEDGFASPSNAVIVEVNSKRMETIPFSKISGSLTFAVQTDEGHEATLEVSESGKARITASTCLDKTCVRTGWISRPGQSIVCLPNRLVVRIEGTEAEHTLEPSLDAITY